MRKIYAFLMITFIGMMIFFSTKSDKEKNNQVTYVKSVESIRVDAIEKKDVGDKKKTIGVSIVQLEKEIEEIEESLDLENLLKELNDSKLSSLERERIIKTVNDYTHKLSKLAELETKMIEKRIEK